jgi:hypothetical protein
MALRDEIEVLRDRALGKLNDAHDYFTYSKRLWRTLQRSVEYGRQKFSWRNLFTSSSANEQDLLAKAHLYVSQELTSSTLQQFVSIFESFLFDALRSWLLAHPQSLARRQLSGRDILELPDKAAIVDALVEKELKDVFYDRPANWFEYLNERVQTGSPTSADAQRFAEIKATRDVLVHGQGIANPYYMDKSGAEARAQVGQSLGLSEPYHHASWELLVKLTREIGDGMAAKA